MAPGSVFCRVCRNNVPKPLRQRTSNNRSNLRPGVRKEHQCHEYEIRFGSVTALIVITIFLFDEEIISFLLREGVGWKILAAICVFAFIPFFAHLYSTVIRLFLKMLKFD